MFILDTHAHECPCSYCVDYRHQPQRNPAYCHFGLNIPQDWKSWNSWWVIKYWPNRYIRWTNPWLAWFQSKKAAR